VEFIIPAEGTVMAPYVMSLVKNSPQPENGKKILDFILSDEGQAVWANAFLRPVRPTAMSAEVAGKFLPASEYARAKSVDWKKMADVQQIFRNRYLNEVR
jgi:putative spermidine/putrescine transport system substrate-binding protein